VEFFPATDGKAHPIPDDLVSKSWNTKNNSLYGAYEDVFDKEDETKLLYSKAQFEDPGVEYDLSAGERGCAHSHIRMWQRAAEAEGPTLILEDDVELVFKRTLGRGRMSNGKVFTERLNLAMAEAAKKKADVLYLAWSGYRDGRYLHHKAKPGKKSPIIRKSEYVWTTAAYVIWPEGAKKLLAAATPMNQPVDNFMAWECREGRLDAYVILDEGDVDGNEPTVSGGIAGQRDFTGDSDIKKSDGGDQGDDPTAFLTKKVAEEPAEAAAPAEAPTAAAADAGA